MVPGLRHVSSVIETGHRNLPEFQFDAVLNAVLLGTPGLLDHLLHLCQICVIDNVRVETDEKHHTLGAVTAYSNKPRSIGFTKRLANRSGSVGIAGLQKMIKL